MLANHTSIASVSAIFPFSYPALYSPRPRHQLFKRMIDQFDRLRKRNAFMEQYKKEKMFENGLEEFDDARCAPTFRGADDQVSKGRCLAGRRRKSCSRSTRPARAQTTSHM